MPSNDASESAIQHPDRRCLFFAEEKTGVGSETVNEYDDMSIVVCENTRDAVIKPVNAVKSRAKLCREHAEHHVETGEWEYVSRQKKLVTDGGTVDSEAELRTDGSYRERVISQTSRRHLEVREADCLGCGETVSRLLDTRTFEWDTLPERCWRCGEPTPWEQGLDPVFQDGMGDMTENDNLNTLDGRGR